MTTHTRVHNYYALLAIVLILVYGPRRLSAQTSNDPELPLSTAESLIEDAGDDADLILEDLDELRRHRLDLRRCTPHELAMLPGLTLADAVEILAAIDSLPDMGIGAIARTVGLDPEQRTILRAYTQLRRSPAPVENEPLSADCRFRLLGELQSRRGYRSDLRRVVNTTAAASDTISVGHPFVGSPLGIAGRMRFSAGGIALGVAVEIDPAETWRIDDTLRYSYDRLDVSQLLSSPDTVIRRFGGHRSAFASFERESFMVVAGSIRFRAGEGLLFGGGNGPSVFSSRQTELRGEASISERTSLFGAAVSIAVNPLIPHGRIVALISNQLRDARMVVDSPDSQRIAEGLLTPGSYRSRRDMRTRHTLKENLSALRLESSGRGWRLGTTLQKLDYNAAIEPELVRGFFGRRSYTIAIDGIIERRRGSLAAEIAIATTGRIAVSIRGGWLVRGIELGGMIRSVDPGFPAPYGIAGDRISGNERTLGLSIRGHYNRWLKLACEATTSAHPDRTSTRPIPGSSERLVISASGYPPQLAGIRTAARIDIVRADDLERSDNADGLERLRTCERFGMSARLDLECPLYDERLRLRWRLQQRRVRSLPSGRLDKGRLTGLALEYAPLQQIVIRGSLQEIVTTGFDAAITVVERDVSGRNRIQTISGPARRFSISALWRPYPGLEVEASAMTLRYDDRERIAEGGDDEVEGPELASLTFQIGYRF